MTKLEREILDEIIKYDWLYYGEDGFYEEKGLYNMRMMYESVKKIKQWQYKLAMNGNRSEKTSPFDEKFLGRKYSEPIKFEK